ncbi:Nif3-like dinuclear metal center hexameric protein [Acinetobacter sp. MD2(2019)]|uniref:Nif3-like dinuclear metal center hexameric protein n=1 Tax=Acinetobacter sp. MD2(2019) TaxID=2605273 RepID=UPI002D1E568C|nr:Nif3-like dinuclear metal center hexameric protein [Acinetobacter sp. MD2(2019)]MEB3754004.1 Nif3-like dinuclear metal center hexameric protein [Acinetobacter sp. MD2(2019)]
MASLSNILHWCDQTLKTSEFKDYAPNGLQIEGKTEVRKILCAVTASLDAIDACIEQQADLLLVHHGYFWKGEPAPITGMRGERIKKLIQHDISLLAYHLPLDAHPQYGNNASIAELLDLEHIEALDPSEKHPIGNIGYLKQAMPVQEFKQRLTEKFQREIIHLPAQTSSIQKIGFCTGAAQDFINKAADQHCDAYLSGEVSERTFYEAKEMGVHYFACGHHATEQFGVQRLGQALAEALDLEYAYFELANPI